MELIPAFIRRRIAHRPKLLKIVDNIGWLFFDKILRMGVGLLSVSVPALCTVVTILACNMLAGQYAVAIAAVGLLSTLGITLATDAYGPVADNAGGIAEMAQMPPEVRQRTDKLDALGNTTAATGKGLAIASASWPSSRP